MLKKWCLRIPKMPRISENGKHKHNVHTADRRYTSMSLYNLVHLPIPIPKAMQIPQAKVVVDKERDNLKNLPSWQESNVRNKQEVTEKAPKEGKNNAFCNAHGLKVPIWTTISRCAKGASYSVCCSEGWFRILRSITEQGSSASQITAAKV